MNQPLHLPSSAARHPAPRPIHMERPRPRARQHNPAPQRIRPHRGRPSLALPSILGGRATERVVPPLTGSSAPDSYRLRRASLPVRSPAERQFFAAVPQSLSAPPLYGSQRPPVALFSRPHSGTFRRRCSALYGHLRASVLSYFTPFVSFMYRVRRLDGLDRPAPLFETADTSSPQRGRDPHRAAGTGVDAATSDRHE